MTLPESNGKTVLITGINGYIASLLGQLLLAKGYAVRGTTRKSSSTEPLLNGPYAQYARRIRIFEVPDMTVDGAFDEASKCVDGIFHTASPIDFAIDTFEKMVIPAVRGSEVLLKAALKAGPQLTSVVITSSAIACTNPKDDPEYTFTEKDFASVFLERAIKDRDEGNQTPSAILYGASKTAAERAIWKFKENHKPNFAITTINPSVVIGPPIAVPSHPSQLNQTLKPFFAIFSGSVTEVGTAIGSGGFADVRDVAFMHVWAYENSPVADGERYIACQGFGPLQAVADVLRKEYEGRKKIVDKIPVGKTGEGYVGYDRVTGKVVDVDYPRGKVRVIGVKATEAMGFEYISFPQSIVDTAKALEVLL